MSNTQLPICLDGLYQPVISKATPKWNGYLLYITETLPIVQQNPQILPEEKLYEVGKMYGKLTHEEKQAYKIRAAQLI